MIMNHTLPNILKTEAKKKLIETANSIIKDEIGVVEGCRLISKLIHKAGVEENDLFLPIIGVDSETDDYPLGKVREHYGAEYLEKIDKEIKAYETRNKNLIVEVCRGIIDKYSS